MIITLNDYTQAGIQQREDMFFQYLLDVGHLKEPTSRGYKSALKHKIISQVSPTKSNLYNVTNLTTVNQIYNQVKGTPVDNATHLRISSAISQYGYFLKALNNGGINLPNYPGSGQQSSSRKVQQGASNQMQQSQFMTDVVNAIRNTNLLYEDKLIQRYVCSLMTKPFVILSGLAGSGKTQLALTFAHAMSSNLNDQICVVPVGADWTNREPLLGFPNALKQEEYVLPECGALQIVMRAYENLTRAKNNPDEEEIKPYFLILDEMNLSYVERYFADFLSALESHMEIPLWDKPQNSTSTVPAKIKLPENLFITGTINVDETTYMFSPKVLDRANVIEFKISESEMDSFLNQPNMNVNVHTANGLCNHWAAYFVNESNPNTTIVSNNLAQNELKKFFIELKKVNAEFGYRSATEIYRFIEKTQRHTAMSDEEILDAAIIQKLLPKLHGSRKKLEPALKALWGLCMKLGHTGEDISRENLQNARFPESADKILRMKQTALDNGFTSFAEA
jgi:5-methylcytosine-specific restriction protein B